MGGGDLNLKKSWHPATFRNQERVWKKEHEAEEEKKKLELLLKDREMERQFQELQRLSGIKKGIGRLEWMYAAGPSSSEELISQDREAYLLGKRSIDKILNSREKNEVSDAGYCFFFRLLTHRCPLQRNLTVVECSTIASLHMGLTRIHRGIQRLKC